MTYAAIMVHVQADESAAYRLSGAVALAASFDATLIGVGAEMIAPMTFDNPYMNVQPNLWTALRDVAENNLKNAGKAFRSATALLAKPTLWECGLRMPTDAVARASRAADLIVATSPAHSDAYRDVSAGDLVLAAGRPVLVMAAPGAPEPGRRIVVAWKDTREARRALLDAIPFMKRAEAVLVLSVCSEDEAADALIEVADVVAALARHGVAAVAEVAALGPSDAHHILRRGRQFGADLIVAGGYGHSRAGEWVFGGVTRDLLGQHDVHVLLSH